jgi:uncharacterized RDD family membrane protein YckC
MKRKFLERSPYRIATMARLIAKLIDIFVIMILSIFFYPVGILFSVIYIGIADSLGQGQSVGKKFMGFAVISLEDGSPCSYRQSFIRNLPLIIPLILAIIPIWGWILSFIVGVPLILIEVYLLYRLDSGSRIGDVMADTSVIASDGPRPVKAAMAKTSAGWFEAGSTTQPH